MLRTARSLCTAPRPAKPLYITTPIFYVNAKPHLGHIYSMLLADTRVRWEQLRPGQNTYFLTGTDEHGLKIQAVAEKERIAPKTLVDRVSQNFRALAETFNVQPNRFIRTTDADHLQAVRHFWKAMEAKGFIYKSSHSGWYSVNDEAFYSKTQVEDIIDLQGNRKKVSVETGNEVFFHREENYFFRLSAFQSPLLLHLQANPDFVYPPQKATDLLRQLRDEKLEDLSISRPAPRLLWGIPVPGDLSQTIYVWFDALINYITAAGYPTFPKDRAVNIWPALTHIVGKDIFRFHCVYWPAFLMAVDLPLPEQVLVHSHWLSNGVKMSKSLGNVVDPMELAAYYGVDPARLYLMEQANIATDCRFSEEALYQRRALLLNKWANIGSRLQGGKFLLSRAAQKFALGRLANFAYLFREYGHSTHKDEVLKLVDTLVTSVNTLYADMDAEMSSFGQMYALQRWWDTVELGNALFTLAEPWKYAKAEDAINQRQRDALEDIMDFIVYATAEVGRTLSICISPFMPQLATKFLDQLGVASEKRNAELCTFGADSSYVNAPGGGKLMDKVAKRH